MTAVISAILLSCVNFLPKVGVFASLVVHALKGNIIDAQYVFIVTSFYNVLNLSMNIYFPRGITQMAEAHISVRRLEKFLSHEEVNIIGPSKEKYKQLNGSTHMRNAVGVEMNEVNARWLHNLNENALTNINIKINPSQLVAIVGAVGSGKSSLLNLILKELPIQGGRLRVKGITSYASQESWLYIGTIRENIVFDEPWDEIRYRQVIRVCALERDFSLFLNGDFTIVGEKGATLSGGQRARINLARAVYKQADIYLLDDPLSAVDAHVAKHIFDECICSFLKNKCIVLVTNHLQFLTSVDWIVMLEHGTIKMEGTYGDLKSVGLNFIKLLESAHDVDAGISQTQKSFQYKLQENGEENSTQQKEVRGKGSVGYKVYKRYFNSGGGYCVLTLLAFTLILLQIFISASNFFVGYW